MANAYFGVGAAQGIDAGVRRYKADQMLAEDRAAQVEQVKFDRQRQMMADARTDEQAAYDKAQRPTRERAAQLSLDAGEESLAAARTNRAFAGQDRTDLLADRAEERADRATERTNRANTEKREQGRYDMTKQQFDAQVSEMQKKMKDEGFEDLLDALEGGADPNFAFEKFNGKGKLGIRPGTGKYDPATKTISGVSSNGVPFTGPISNLRALLPQKKPPAPVKIGADERLVAPQKDGTFKDVTPGGGPGPAGAGGGSQYRNKFNWQTHIKEAEDSVFKTMGGNFNTLTQKYDPPEGGGAKVAIAQAFVGDLGRRLEKERVPIEPGELGAIAAEITRDYVVTIGDAEETVRKNPRFKNAGEDAVRAEAQAMVRNSQLQARNAVELEFKEMVRKQRAAEAEAGDLPAPKPSEDIKDDQTQAGAPDVSLLQPGKRFNRRDGTFWTLKEGKPMQVDKFGRDIRQAAPAPQVGQAGGSTGRW